MNGLVARSSAIVVGSVTSPRSRASVTSAHPADERLVVRLDGQREEAVGERIFVAAIDARLRRQRGEPLQVRRASAPRVALEQAAAAHREQGVADEGDLLAAGRWKATWPAVWAGMSISSASIAPIRARSPPATIRSIFDTRSASAGPVIVQPVAARIASLPPVWSGCQWVFQIWVIRQPRAAAAASTGSATDGIDRHRLARGGIVDQPDIIVVEDRDAGRFRAWRANYPLPPSSASASRPSRSVSAAGRLGPAEPRRLARPHRLRSRAAPARRSPAGRAAPRRGPGRARRSAGSAGPRARPPV